MNKPSIGIIGNGFVGEAQAFAFSPVCNIKIYDVDRLKSTHTLSETHNSDFVFVCVPTPTHKNGKQNLKYINEAFKNACEKPIYILKSTVTPGTTDLLRNKFGNIKIIFSPEFLTERTSKLDMLTQNRIILGGKKSLTKSVRKLYELRFKNKNIIETDSTTSELIKYMNNTFFATKVAMMNEYKLLADKIGVNWDDALNGFASDGRIGDSHLDVPGPDGDYGYGGKCFPKDVCALIDYAEKKGVKLNAIIGGWKTNKTVRKNKNWYFE
ncbi:MAG: hypothetical protein CBC40_04515 [bacterium TMED80]|nr:MAG: hypothetical protein CBC40_04515 [bacterium TMED80]|tara:strand:+ start:168 stop:971 length:804 start_codon:yes stop_codon:yes gene_type:complete